jgi:hypothetical protein
MKSVAVIGSAGLITRISSKSETPLPSVSPWTSQIGPPGELFSKRSSPAVPLNRALPMKLNAWSLEMFSTISSFVGRRRSYRVAPAWRDLLRRDQHRVPDDPTRMPFAERLDDHLARSVRPARPRPG